jgi:CheY-like chemotaxis protein
VTTPSVNGVPYYRQPHHIPRALARGYWTTGALAFLLGISPRSVHRLLDQGIIRCHKVGADRRVATGEVLRYVREQGHLHLVPLLLGQSITACLSVCVAGPDPSWPALLLDHLPPGWAVARCPTLYHVGRSGGHVLVLSASLGRGQLLELARSLADEPQRPGLVGLASEDDGDLAAWLAAGFQQVLRTPCDPLDVANAIVQTAKPPNST